MMRINCDAKYSNKLLNRTLKLKKVIKMEKWKTLSFIYILF